MDVIKVQAHAIIELMITLLLLGIVGLLDVAVVVKLVHAFRLLKVPADETIKDSELPTISVCIAARNETHAMTQCLERVVASDYPKLEIIVLDDGSRDDTSLLIKSFAHAGVRFVEGKPLPAGWLGKNYAQSLLANEASGKYVFFMDVDTLIDRHTILRATQYALTRQSKMVSFIPIRNDYFQISTLLTTMRHFWTLMRFRPVKPRAASNAWLIDRQTLLHEFTADASLQESVEVETTIARRLAGDHKYRLVLSNTWLGLRYEKRWSSQIETSIRLLYPQNGKHWYQVFVLVILLLITLIPYGIVWLEPWAAAIILIQFVMAYYYLSHIWQRYRVIGAILLPVTIVQEIALLLTSMYQYKFGTITWKGRPITASK